MKNVKKLAEEFTAAIAEKLETGDYSIISVNEDGKGPYVNVDVDMDGMEMRFSVTSGWVLYHSHYNSFNPKIDAETANMIYNGIIGSEKYKNEKKRHLNDEIKRLKNELEQIQ